MTYIYINRFIKTFLYGNTNDPDSQILCRMSNARVIVTRSQIILQSHDKKIMKWNRQLGNKPTQLKPPNFRQSFKNIHWKRGSLFSAGKS